MKRDTRGHVDLRHRADHDVQEVAVVADQEHAAGILREELLQPGARLDVEVVRRLVQEQDVGRLEDGARQGDPHLPARGERPLLFLEIRRGEAEPGEDAVDRLLPRVIPAGFQLFAQRVMLPQEGVPLGRLRRQGPQALLQRRDLLRDAPSPGKRLFRLLLQRTGPSCSPPGAISASDCGT